MSKEGLQYFQETHAVEGKREHPRKPGEHFRQRHPEVDFLEEHSTYLDFVRLHKDCQEAN